MMKATAEGKKGKFKLAFAELTERTWKENRLLWWKCVQNATRGCREWAKTLINDKLTQFFPEKWSRVSGDRAGMNTGFLQSNNRPLLSSKTSHFRNEAKSETFLVKMNFTCMRITYHFHINSVTLIRGGGGGSQKHRPLGPQFGPKIRALAGSTTALDPVLKQRLEATLTWNIVRDKDNSCLQRWIPKH